RYVALDNLLPFVKSYTTRPRTHVPVVSISHLAGPIHDAAHDSYLDTFQMERSCSDLCRGFLKVKERPAARRTRDILRLGNSRSRGLQNIKCRFVDKFITATALC